MGVWFTFIEMQTRCWQPKLDHMTGSLTFGLLILARDVLHLSFYQFGIKMQLNTFTQT